jgi:hypothetical protein
MTTLATPDFKSGVTKDERLTVGMLAYFASRLSGLAHQALLKILGRLERQDGFTKRAFAHRIRRKPEQITRWFSYPSNLTLETISAILLGAGYEVERIVLKNLATGECIHVPEQRQYVLQAVSAPQRNPAEISAFLGRHVQGTAESVQESSSQSNKAAGKSSASALA